MSLTGGRRPVPTRGVFAIEDHDLLPDPLALDTSFVVEALLTTQPLHGVCDAFLTRIFDSGVSVVTSELLHVELAESAFAIALKERWGGRWRGHRTDGRSRRPATRRLNHNRPLTARVVPREATSLRASVKETRKNYTHLRSRSGGNQATLGLS